MTLTLTLIVLFIFLGGLLGLSAAGYPEARRMRKQSKMLHMCEKELYAIQAQQEELLDKNGSNIRSQRYQGLLKKEILIRLAISELRPRRENSAIARLLAKCTDDTFVSEIQASESFHVPSK